MSSSQRRIGKEAGPLDCFRAFAFAFRKQIRHDGNRHLMQPGSKHAGVLMFHVEPLVPIPDFAQKSA